MEFSAIRTRGGVNDGRMRIGIISPQTEETPKSSVETPCVFSRRKSPLKSETYGTLLRIITRCYSQPQLCEIRPLPSQDPISDKVSNGPGGICREEVAGHIEAVGAAGMDCDSSNSMVRKQSAVVAEVDLGAVGFRDNGFSDVQAVIDSIENMMGVEEDVGELVERDMMREDGAAGNGPRDGESSRVQQSLIDELENVLDGNEEPVRDNNCDLVTLLLDKNEGVDQQTISKEHSTPSASETLDLPLDKSKRYEVSKVGHGGEDNSFSWRKSDSGKEHDMLHKERGLDKSVRAAGVQSSPAREIEDGEVEEGEISVTIQKDDRFIGTFAEEAEVPVEKKIDGRQVSHNLTDNDGFRQKDEANKKVSLPTSSLMIAADNAKRNRVAKGEANIGDKLLGKRKVVVYEDPILGEETSFCDKQKEGHSVKKQKKGHEAIKQKQDIHEPKKQKKGPEAYEQKKCSGHEAKKKKKGDEAIEKKKYSVIKDIVSCKVTCPENVEACLEDQNAAAGQGNTYEHKDAGPGNKKKRGPCSAESKEKKKIKKRKKRAQRDREQGVKRLKLRPVQISKPVSYCRHFLMGRCQEGEKCKFSHDTIPLTKSKPCCHFARHSCMKGDDCPFDHQLSKYPCTSFVSKGFCSKGETCSFSHKLPLKEDLPNSNVNTSALKLPALAGTSDSKKQLDLGRTSNQMVKALAPSAGVISHKHTEQIAVTSVPLVPARVPKGISFLSTGKSLTVDCRHPQLSSSSASNKSVEFGHQADQSAPGKVQRLNESPKKTPAPPPKGINFLSFCRSPSEYSCLKKHTCLPVDHGSMEKASAPNSSVADKQSGPPLVLDNSVKVGREARMKELLPKTEAASTPFKPLLSSFGEPSTSNSRSNPHVNLFSLARIGDKAAESNKNASVKHPNLSANPWALPPMPHSLSQSSDHVGQTPNSVHEALMSTLAFAAKVEAEMKPNRYANTVSNVVNDKAGPSTSSRVSQNTPSKAAKILDFLYTIGDNTKQQ